MPIEPNELIRLCVAAAVVAVLCVYLLLYRRLRSMKTELASLRAEAATAAARIAEMQRFAAEQAQHLTNAYAEREDLLADSRSLREKLREQDDARDDARDDGRNALRRF
jgi:predicted Holliday junction resolvase-like endonuclease